MSLVKCKECGNEVSSKADACPKCGAKTKKKGIGIIGWLAIFFVVSAVVSAINPRTQNTNNAGSSTASKPAPPPPQKTPKEEAMETVEIKDYNWHTGGFGSVMFIDVTFQNKGKRDVKDIEIECTDYSNSGTKIDSNTKTIYEIVQAGKSRSIKNFNMGFIHSQATKTNCVISDLVPM